MAQIYLSSMDEKYGRLVQLIDGFVGIEICQYEERSEEICELVREMRRVEEEQQEAGILTEQSEGSKLEIRNKIQQTRMALVTSLSQILDPKHENHNTCDYDTLLSISCLLLSKTPQLDDALLIRKVLEKGLWDDPKYAFLLLSAKIHQLEPHPIERMKLVAQAGIFMPSLISTPQNIFNDYLIICRQAKTLYESIKHENSSNVVVVGEKKEESFNVDKIYLKFCAEIMNSCQASNRVKKCVEEAVSLLVILGNDSEPNFINKCEYFLSTIWQEYADIDKIPCNLLPFLLKSNSPLPLIYSPTILISILSQISLHLLPQSTTSTYLGSLTQKLDFSIQDIVRLISTLFLSHKITIDTHPQINFLPVFHRITIYFGYVNQKSNKQLHESMSRIMALPHFSDVNRAKVWLYCLKHDSTQNCTNYQIFCLGNYRKILQNMFRNRKNEEQCTPQSLRVNKEIVMLTEKLIFTHLSSVRKQRGKEIDCNYVGHLISLIDNFLLYYRYLSSVVRRWEDLAQTMRSECLSVCELMESEKKRIEIIQNNKNSEGQVTQIDLCLFRMEQLIWQ